MWFRFSSFLVLGICCCGTSINGLLNVVTTSPDAKTVHDLKGISEEKFEFKAPTRGIHKFCFHYLDCEVSYTSENVVEGKKAAKEALQQIFGLKRDDLSL